MERAAVQPTRHWAIAADYFQQTFEDLFILCRVLRPRRICDIYDFFAPFINLLTVLLTRVRYNSNFVNDNVEDRTIQNTVRTRDSFDFFPALYNFHP